MYYTFYYQIIKPFLVLTLIQLVTPCIREFIWDSTYNSPQSYPYHFPPTSPYCHLYYRDEIRLHNLNTGRYENIWLVDKAGFDNCDASQSNHSAIVFNTNVSFSLSDHNGHPFIELPLFFQLYFISTSDGTQNGAGTQKTKPNCRLKMTFCVNFSLGSETVECMPINASCNVSSISPTSISSRLTTPTEIISTLLTTGDTISSVATVSTTESQNTISDPMTTKTTISPLITTTIFPLIIIPNPSSVDDNIIGIPRDIFYYCLVGIIAIVIPLIILLFACPILLFIYSRYVMRKRLKMEEQKNNQLESYLHQITSMPNSQATNLNYSLSSAPNAFLDSELDIYHSQPLKISTPLYSSILNNSSNYQNRAKTAASFYTTSYV